MEGSGKLEDLILARQILPVLATWHEWSANTLGNYVAVG